MKRNILLIITIVLVIIVTIIYNFSNYRKNFLLLGNANSHTVEVVFSVWLFGVALECDVDA